MATVGVKVLNVSYRIVRLLGPYLQKMTVICKNGVKVRVRVRVKYTIRVRSGLGSGLPLGLAFRRCTDKGHIFTDKG